MLTTEQLAVFKTALAAETDPELVGYRTNGQTGLIAEWYNKPAIPDHIVWKRQVTSEEVGTAFDAAALDAMTAGNADKLANFRAWNEQVFPERTDHRAFFSGVFSVASGATTRANLDVLWRRPATNIEKLYTTGLATTASPAVLGFDGALTEFDVLAALREV